MPNEENKITSAINIQITYIKILIKFIIDTDNDKYKQR